MFKTIACTAISVAVLLPTTSFAQGNEPPAVVVRARSVEGIVEAMNVLSKEVDKGKVGTFLQQFIKTHNRAKGLVGIDTKRPVGAYLYFRRNHNEPVIMGMIPIRDSSALLQFLKDSNFAVKKMTKGLYLIQEILPTKKAPRGKNFLQPRGRAPDFGIRFANQYAYVTQFWPVLVNTKRLISPARIFPKQVTATLSATLHLEQLPKAIKRDLIRNLQGEFLFPQKKKGEPKFEEFKDKKSDTGSSTPPQSCEPGVKESKSDPQEKKRQFQRPPPALAKLLQPVEDFLSENNEVLLTLDVDAKKQTLVGEITINSHSKSKFAKHFAALKKGKSLFGSLMKKEVDIAGVLRLQLSNELRRDLAPVVDQAFTEILKDVPRPAKQQIQRLLKILTPTAKAGELDTGLQVQFYETGHVGVVLGVKIKHGTQLEKMLKPLVRLLPAEDQGRVKFNVAKVGRVSIHRLDLQDLYVRPTRMLIGNSSIYFALRKDALIVTTGINSLQRMKSVLTAKPVLTPAVHVQFHPISLARLFNPQGQNARIKKFVRNKKGAIRLVVNGGKTLNVQLDTPFAALESFRKARQNNNNTNDTVLHTVGNMKVNRGKNAWVDALKGPNQIPYRYLLRDGIHFGLCYEHPMYRRLATTYYHPQGPVGIALKKFNWFPGLVDTYFADARLPASLVAQSAPLLTAQTPLTRLACLWSEPPVAVIGMNAGTTASYARPLQHFHYYEPNKDLIRIHQGKGKKRFFHHVPDAKTRGAQLHIFQGSPRQQLRKHGPRKFYHLMIMEACSGENGEKFFLNLLIKEGIAQCMEHLVEDGVLCVHISHRFVNLAPVLATIANDLKLQVRRGYDQAPGSRLGPRAPKVAELGHFMSEWVLLARHKRTLDAICKAPKNYKELQRKTRFNPNNPYRYNSNEPYWSIPKPSKHLWTDKGPNLLHDVLRGHPVHMQYTQAMQPWLESAEGAIESLGIQNFETRMVVYNMFNYPNFVDQWMKQWQLKNAPDVRQLWP